MSAAIGTGDSAVTITAGDGEDDERRNNNNNNGVHTVTFDDVYGVCFLVGRGSTGNVYAVRRRDDGPTRPGAGLHARPELFACKDILVDAGPSSSPSSSSATVVASSGGTDVSAAADDAPSPRVSLRSAMSEAALLMSLRHPNIVAIQDVFLERSSMKLVTRLLTGGELASVVDTLGALPEQHARAAIRAILSAVSYMHSPPHRVAHRDLKLENVLLPSPHSSLDELQLIDFGMSKKLGEGRGDHSICGSPLYIAPELVAGGGRRDADSSRRVSFYGLEADVWSCGVMLYILLSGHPPFSLTSGIFALFKQIQQGAYSFPPEMGWGSVSLPAIDLVKRMMCVDPNTRITAEAALKHPWLAQQQ